MSDEITATHVHVENQARDCDGLYDRDSVEEGDLTAVFRWFHLPTTPSTVNLDTNDDGLWTLHVSAPTEEGYTSTTFRECAYDCELDHRSFRDHTAEAAGY